MNTLPKKRPIDMLRWWDVFPTIAFAFGLAMVFRAPPETKYAWLVLAFFAAWNFNEGLIARFERYEFERMNSELDDFAPLIERGTEIIEAVRLYGEAWKAVVEDARARTADEYMGKHWYCDGEEGTYDPCPLHRAEADAERRLREVTARLVGLTFPEPPK